LFATPSPPPPPRSGPWDALPPTLRFGASSWTYPGWKGSIYRRDYGSEKAFRETCLVEYAAHPWFGCVGIDSSFYRPPSAQTVDRYVAQTPSAFRWLPKVWEQITIRTFGSDRVPRGFRPGDPNPAFLDPEVFAREVLPSWDRPLLFQFASLGRHPSASTIDEFCKHFDWFLGRIPRSQNYAVEIRTPALLHPWWFDLLHHHGVAHVFNHWDGMPPLSVQRDVAAAAKNPPPPFRVVRLLTPLSTTYTASVEQFMPYDRLRAVQPACREDTVSLVVDALANRMETFVIANNRLEGHSPTTVEAIATTVLEQL
jgi:uncharacterized protein YecE (DUF72 family)